MSAVVLILSDLYPPRLAPAASDAWPRLPALERWLARGQRFASDQNWRVTLVGQYGGAAGGAISLGGVAAAGWLAATGGQQHYWLATPIHAVAGLDTVRLHPNGLLYLDEPHQQQLADDFSRVFMGSGWELHATARRELLLSGPPSNALRTEDPARWLGTELDAAMPAGNDAASLRRMAAELEMWLHGHVANRQRMARGVPVATGLWLWGGGPAAPLAPTQLPTLFGDDLVAQGIWRLGSGPARPLPDTLGAVQGEGDAVIILPILDADSLRAVDERWLAPALSALASGTLREAELWVAGRQVRMTRALYWRAWRRGRPWWELI